jgi:hypothetical protein
MGTDRGMEEAAGGWRRGRGGGGREGRGGGSQAGWP